MEIENHHDNNIASKKSVCDFLKDLMNSEPGQNPFLPDETFLDAINAKKKKDIMTSDSVLK